MAHQTLKRKFEDLNSNNDDLNDDEYDVTWGGKRSRYLYNYKIQTDLFSSMDDSDETESILSIQSKSTVEMVSEEDIVSESSCGSDCSCRNSSQWNLDEFDVRSLSSSNISDSTTSDSSTTIGYMLTKDDNFSKSEDDGFTRNAEETEGETTIEKQNIPTPACFINCLQCQKENPNPYFQYCFTCFRYRMERFENKPKPKKKKMNTSNEEKNYSHNFGSIGMSPEILGDIKNLCNICSKLPKDGVFNHGKIGHIYCCFKCAKKIRKKTKKCPICHVKVQFITKLYIK